MPFQPPPFPADENGQTHIGRLVDDADYLWPWPYTPGQIDSLRATLPLDDAHRADWLRGIVAIARRSVIGRRLQNRQARAAKVNLRAEILRIDSARRDFVDALKCLSTEGHDFLSRRDERWSKQFAAALTAMFDFEYADIDSSNAPGPSLGPPGDEAIVWAAHQFDLWWTTIHGGTRPKYGSPAFREASLKPIFGEFSARTLESRLPKWRAEKLPPISHKITPR